MNQYIPSPGLVVRNVVAIIVAGALASIIVSRFPAYKKWVDTVLLP